MKWFEEPNGMIKKKGLGPSSMHSFIEQVFTGN